jgi:hypothetical protein
MGYSARFGLKGMRDAGGFTLNPTNCNTMSISSTLGSRMPTEFTAQNGAVFTQQTPIKVTGCKTKPLTRQQKLLKALKQCHKKHGKAKRRSCEGQARKRYGARKKKGKKG